MKAHLRFEHVCSLLVLSGTACSLMAPSDAELLGGAHGGRTAFGSGGLGEQGGSGTEIRGGSQSSTAGKGSSLAGTTSAQGGAVPQAGTGSGNEGGEAGAGGNTAFGGNTALGGDTALGGSPAKGGNSALGGSLSQGGAPANGGAVSRGGSGQGGAAPASGGSSTSGGAVSTGGKSAGSGGTLGSGGLMGTGGTSYCASNPCAHGSCAEVSGGYKCTCSAGWGGTQCNVGSCANMSCSSAAPCMVPDSGAVAVCYPSACGSGEGLCMAENADGSGATVLISGRNADFNPLSSANWRNRAKYFGYVHNAHGGYACVFPQLDEGGTPLVIPLGTVRTKSAGFGQSNSWPNPPTCSYP